MCDQYFIPVNFQIYIYSLEIRLRCCHSYILWPRDSLIPRRGGFIDPEPALEPRDAEVHRDGEVLTAIVDLADFANVEAKCQIQPLSVGHCEKERFINFPEFSLPRPRVLYWRAWPWNDKYPRKVNAQETIACIKSSFKRNNSESQTARHCKSQLPRRQRRKQWWWNCLVKASQSVKISSQEVMWNSRFTQPLLYTFLLLSSVFSDPWVRHDEPLSAHISSSLQCQGGCPTLHMRTTAVE